MRFQVVGGPMAKRWMMSSGLFLVLLSLFIFEFPKFFSYLIGGLILVFGILIFFGGLMAPSQPKSGKEDQGNQTEDGTWEDLS